MEPSLFLTMTSKDNRPGDAAPSAGSLLRQPVPRSFSEGGGSGGQAGQALRRRAEEIAREKAAQIPKNLETLSCEEAAA